MRLFPIALAAGFVALAPAAHAETLTVTGITEMGPVFVLTVPTVEVEDGNLTEAQIKALFAGDASAVPALGTLTAKSIKIPKIEVKTNVGSQSSTSIYTDFEITGVTNGVAASASLGGIAVTAPDDVSVSFGKTSVDNLNIAALLNFYGMGSGTASTEPQTLYSNIHLDGGKIVSPDVACTIAPASIAEFKARPPKAGPGGMMELASQIEAETKDGGPPDPKMLAQLITAYADFINSFEMSPVAFNGLDCSGKSEKGSPLKVTLGGFSMDAWKQAVFPAISVSDLLVDVGQEGYFKLKSATLKPIDFTGTLKVLTGAGETLTPAWFAQNYRLLIPIINGFSLAGLEADIPTEGQKTRVTVGSFDVTLGNYIKGVPSHSALTMTDLVMPIADVGQPLTEALKARGVTAASIDGGFAFDWDPEAKTATFTNLNLGADQLGTIMIDADLGNVTPDAFSDNPRISQRAQQMITIKSLHLVLDNQGAMPILLGLGAQQSGQTEEAFRATLVGVSSGLTMALLGASPQTLGTAGAIADFLAGRPHLDLTLTATDAEGIGSALFEAAQKDPTILAGKIALTATASGDLPPASDVTTAPAPDAAPAATDAAPSMSDAQSEKQGDKAPAQ